MEQAITADLVPLDIQLKMSHGVLVVTATVAGQVVKECEVKLLTPKQEMLDGITNEQGQATFSVAQPGRYAIRVRHVDSEPGTLNDKSYAQTKTYATATVDVANSDLALGNDALIKLADLPTTLTSFGAAMIDQDVYVYGGTKGDSHDYYKGVQSGSLLRMQLSSSARRYRSGRRLPKALNFKAGACKRPGLLYRIGGFEAKNAKGEEGDLWSTASVSCFDPAKKEWRELPSLPSRDPRLMPQSSIIRSMSSVVGRCKAMIQESGMRRHGNLI